jgi:hypothetical protein
MSESSPDNLSGKPREGRAQHAGLAAVPLGLLIPVEIVTEKLSFLRSVLSHTGTCDSMSFSSTIQVSICAVPYPWKKIMGLPVRLFDWASDQFVPD